MKHSQCYFSNTRITLYALFLCMIPTEANAQLFGGMMKASKNIIIIDIGIPATITLMQNASYFVVSVHDDHYLPYTVPTGPATTDVINVGTGNPLVDVQGVITTTGVTISIPAGCTGSGTLPAYSATATIPAGMTQDGIARDLMLSWAAQAYTINTTYITATLKAVGGTLNAKKLDLNAGLGSDYLGVLLGKILYPFHRSGVTTNFAVRVMSGILDRMFGLADNGGIVRHNFLYCPVIEMSKVWLNNNLGADYANTNSGSFNPTQQATSAADFHAYGSLFQWGRKPDGHELVGWSSSTAGTLTSATGPRTDNPVNTNFIPGTPTAPIWDWRSTQNDNAWLTEASTNNPCPSGFRVPTINELEGAAVNYDHAVSSSLHLSLSGYRIPNTGVLTKVGNTGFYWSLSVSGVDASERNFKVGSKSSYATGRSLGMAVRCIKN